MDAREKLFIRELKKYFRDQEKRLIETLQPNKAFKFRKKDLFDEIMQIDVEVAIGKGIFLPIMTKMLLDAGIDAKELVGSAFDFNLSADISSWLDERSDIFLNQINETTFKKLRAEFTESLGAGESRDKLIKRIENTYGDINESRAATIARTEVHNATQKGTIEGYRQAGLQIKIWTSVLDPHTRISHSTLDGQERRLDMPFSNGLMFPGDPRGSAEEVINCRCTI